MMKRIIILLFFVVSVASCCTPRKTSIVTYYEVDTIIKVKVDTVTIIKESFLTDTVEIENSTSVAKSYYNPIKQRIVLELKGKIFDVPVKLQGKKQIQTEEIIRKEKQKIPFKYWLALVFIFTFIFAYITKR